MMAGPRTTLRTTRAPGSITTRPVISESSTRPSTRGSSVSSTIRFASRRSSSFPVSFHHPSITWGRTARPWSMRYWMASVISSSPRPDGRMPAGRVEDVVVEHVDAHEREVGRRHGRLLDEPDDAVAVQDGDPELLGVRHLREQDLGGGRRGLEPRDERGERLPDQVVAEVHHERLAPEERLGRQDGVRQSERGLLRDVGDPHAPAAPVAHRLADLLVGVADDDPDLLETGRGERLEPVEQDGLVGDRDQLLGRRVGDRPEAGAAPAREDQPAHAHPLAVSPHRAAQPRWRCCHAR